MGMDFSELLKGTEMDEPKMFDETKDFSETIKEISLDEFMQRMAKVTHKMIIENENNSMEDMLHNIFTISIVTDFVTELSHLLFASRIDFEDIPNSKDIKVKFDIADFIAASKVLMSVKLSKTNKIIKEIPETEELFILIIINFLNDLYLEEE